MTTENETEFLIIDVEDLPVRGPSHRPKGPLSIAFAKLPLGKAILRPGVPNISAIITSLSRQFPERQMHSRQDKERDGVWVWWEPKPENGTKP